MCVMKKMNSIVLMVYGKEMQKWQIILQIKRYTLLNYLFAFFFLNYKHKYHRRLQWYSWLYWWIRWNWLRENHSWWRIQKECFTKWKRWVSYLMLCIHFQNYNCLNSYRLSHNKCRHDYRSSSGFGRNEFENESSNGFENILARSKVKISQNARKYCQSNRRKSEEEIMGAYNHHCKCQWKDKPSIGCWPFIRGKDLTKQKCHWNKRTITPTVQFKGIFWVSRVCVKYLQTIIDRT